jgi:2,4-didehydro-3-deoxy-L-rhamnonate hydrolase
MEGTMKLVRYGRSGKEKPGLIDSAGKLRDLSEVVADIDADTLSPRALARLARIKPETLPAVRGTPRLGPCVAKVGNFIAIGLNYADHAAESGQAVPKEPVLFNKAPSCIAGPNDDIVIPKGSTKTDWEVELAVVIGSRASYVGEDEALKHVAGYCVCNDVSEREFQLERSGQWTKGKGCPTFGPLGPWLVTPDEIEDPQKLDMWLDVNGERMQSGSTATMVFGVKTLVSYISQFMILEPGDVITTGTPPGVGLGKKPPRFLKPGDRVSLGIGGLGSQTQQVVAYKAP